MSELPAHVSAVEADRLRLAGACKPLLAALRQSPYAERLFRDDQLRPCLRLTPDNPYTDADLHALLTWLAQHEVAFAERMDIRNGPAELMRALQAEGSVPAAFDGLIVRSAEDWERIAHPLKAGAAGEINTPPLGT